MGQRDFGENRIEEINRKAPLLPADIKWHLIGPLQSKKVKLYSANVFKFHALDRVKIWRKLQQWCEENTTRVNAMIQIHIADEESKHGFSYEEIDELIKKKEQQAFPLVDITGLMGMATFTDDQNKVTNEFETLKAYFDDIKTRGIFGSSFRDLSMGMSGDYELALEKGATVIRVGSKIFGPRDYD